MEIIYLLLPSKRDVDWLSRQLPLRGKRCHVLCAGTISLERHLDCAQADEVRRVAEGRAMLKISREVQIVPSSALYFCSVHAPGRIVSIRRDTILISKRTRTCYWIFINACKAITMSFKITRNVIIMHKNFLQY